MKKKTIPIHYALGIRSKQTAKSTKTDFVVGYKTDVCPPMPTTRKNNQGTYGRRVYIRTRNDNIVVHSMVYYANNTSL